jgi:photosystem II stability/assembly factor-like uncharacterized protein
MKTLTIILLFIAAQISESQWQQQSSGTNRSLKSVSFIDINTGWICGDSGLILYTTNGGVNWAAQQSEAWLTLNSITAPYSQAGYVWAVGEEGTIRKTSNFGANWGIYAGLPGTYQYTCASFGNGNLGWMVGRNGLFLNTANGGTNWVIRNTGTAQDLNSVTPFLTVGYAVGNAGTIIKTTNLGSNFTAQSSMTISHLRSVDFSIDSINKVFAVGDDGTIRFTSNGGLNWTARLSGTTARLNSVDIVSGSLVWIAGAGGLILFSSNNGINWVSQPSGTVNGLNMIYMNGTAGWIVGDNGTILKTTNGGMGVPVSPALLSPQNNSTGNSLTTALVWDSIPGVNTYKLQVAGDSLFTLLLINDSSLTSPYYSFQQGILLNGRKYFWRVRGKNAAGIGPYSEAWNFTTAPVGIQQISGEVPDKFSLEQNYPNPFNPVTNIKFSVAKAGTVTLRIYDITGRLTAELLNEHKNPGIYIADFNASNLASGVYFYRMETERFTDIKKMILVK